MWLYLATLRLPALLKAGEGLGPGLREDEFPPLHPTAKNEIAMLSWKVSTVRKHRCCTWRADMGLAVDISSISTARGR